MTVPVSLWVSESRVSLWDHLYGLKRRCHSAQKLTGVETGTGPLSDCDRFEFHSRFRRFDFLEDCRPSFDDNHLSQKRQKLTYCMYHLDENELVERFSGIQNGIISHSWKPFAVIGNRAINAILILGHGSFGVR